MSKLTMVEFYTGMLCSAGMIVNPDGVVMMDDGSGARPITINNAVLHLPTAELLNSGNVAGKVVFHPAWESAVRKESIVFKRLSEMFRSRIQYVLRSLMENLMYLAADHSKHHLLSPEQSRFLSILPDADAKSRDALKAVLNAVGPKTGKKLVTFFMKKNGVWKGNEVRRLAKVSFPLMDERTSGEKSLFGIAPPIMSLGRKNEILNLLDFILPDIIGDVYSFGTDEINAPNLQALCGAYVNVVSRLNEVVEQYENVLTDGHELISPVDWYSSIDQVQNYRNSAPLFPGNEGELADGSAAPTEAAVIAQQVPVTTQAATPVQKPLLDKNTMFGEIQQTTTLNNNNVAKPAASNVSTLPKWTDLAKQAVSQGRLQPGNPMEDVMLNNPGAKGIIVVDQNGNVVQNANPNMIMQQSQQNMQLQQLQQAWYQWAMANGLNPMGMDSATQQISFKTWMGAGGANMLMPNNGMGFNQQQQQGFNQMGFSMNNNQGTNPWDLPGRALVRQAQQQQQGFGWGNNNNNNMGMGFTQPITRMF